MTTTVARLSAVCALAFVLAACAPTSEDETAAPPPTMEMTPQVVAPAQDGESSQALDDFVAAAQPQIPAIMDTSPGTYSEITITAVHPDTLEFTYRFAQPVDPAEAVPYFESMLPTFQSTAETDVFPSMSNAGVGPTQKVAYTYLNADGSTVWTHTFEPS